MLIIKRLKTRSTAEVADTFNVSRRQVQRIRNVSKWPLWSNQCPETSTEQKTIKKPCGFCQCPQPAKRMDTGGRSGRRWISQMKLLLLLILLQDGAPSHTSISTLKFLKAKKIKVLQDWPAQSPDMNIIEHVWGRMKEEAWKRKPNNLDELWEACKTAFFAIPDDFINKLYESLPNRMDAVLQAHGSHTIY